MSAVTEAADRLETWLDYAQNQAVIPADDLRTIIAAARRGGALSRVDENTIVMWSLKARALAAVIEKALSVGSRTGYSHHKEPVMHVLSTADTAAILRERDAEVWDEGAQAVRDRMIRYGDRGMDDPDNPYRKEATDD